jgi:hypothetical protein
MKKTTIVFWSLVGAITLSLTLVIVTSFLEKKQNQATAVEAQSIPLPAEPTQK